MMKPDDPQTITRTITFFPVGIPVLQRYEACSEDGARTQGGAAKFLQPPVLLKQLPADYQ